MWKYKKSLNYVEGGDTCVWILKWEHDFEFYIIFIKLMVKINLKWNLQEMFSQTKLILV
jgi:hypothetical protein